MRTWREELDQLRDELAQLTELTEQEMCGNLPHFYRHFDTMKNNIEIFIYAGEGDIDDFLPVLERDWRASHASLTGILEYDPGECHPKADPVSWIGFLELLSRVEKFCERRKYRVDLKGE